MTLWIVCSAIETLAIGALLRSNIRLQRQLRFIHQERAKQVEQALQNAVLVDGVTLPLPEDERWLEENRVFTVLGKSQSPEVVLHLGLVVVDRDASIYSGYGPCLPRTAATKKYVQHVWIAYRSRIARKAIAGE